jgi:hypothetical protein
VATLSNPTLYNDSRLQAYGWCTFCIELLCGVVLMLWYVLYLAETMTLQGVTRLEKFAASPLSDPVDRSGESSSACPDQVV